MARKIISNKLLLYIICIICILILLYLGYIIFKQNIVEGLDPTFSGEWLAPQNKSCTGYDTSVQNTIFQNIKQNGNSIDYNNKDIMNQAIQFCSKPDSCTNTNQYINPPLTSVDTIAATGNWNFANPWVGITRNKDATCLPKWGDWTHQCIGYKSSSSWANLYGIAGDKTIATNNCLNSNDCGIVPTHDKTFADANHPFQPVGTVYNSNDDTCLPKWGVWTHQCTGIQESSSWANLYGVIGDNTIATTNCLNSDDCGQLPIHDNKTPPLGDPNHAFQPIGTVYNSKDDTCNPKWEPWQAKKCTGFGVSQQASMLDLPPGVDNSDTNGEAGIAFCSVPDSSACSAGNPALNTPHYNISPTSGDTYVYSKQAFGQRWANITIADDPYCYPTWQPWQAKTCTGYKTSKTASRLTIPSLQVPGQPDKSLTDAVNFCFKPENLNRCSGPSPSVPQGNSSLNPPKFDTMKGDTVISSVQGIGEAWGEIDFVNDETCMPTWEKDVPKQKLRYGIALYGPRMNGISKDWEVDCNRLMNDISYTSIDKYTWTPDQKLCKGDTCYSASLVKQCQKTAFGAWGNFLKRDPEYANNAFSWFPLSWPSNFIDVVKYYSEYESNQIPGDDSNNKH